MSGERISGALAASVTPLRDGGERLDEEALEPLFEFYAASGIDGLLVLGTTGEGIMLTGTERRRAAEAAVALAGPLDVIVHCGAQTTAASAGSPKRCLARWISRSSASRSRAGMVRSLGFWAIPVVKARLQEVQPSSKAR